MLLLTISRYLELNVYRTDLILVKIYGQPRYGLVMAQYLFCPDIKKFLIQAPVPPMKGNQALKETSGRRAGAGASLSPLGAGGPVAAGVAHGAGRSGGGSASVERIKTSHSGTSTQNNEEILFLRSRREIHRETKGF